MHHKIFNSEQYMTPKAIEAFGFDFAHQFFYIFIYKQKLQAKRSLVYKKNLKCKAKCMVTYLDYKTNSRTRNMTTKLP